jgi:multimeric flavodoxin WrbA
MPATPKMPDILVINASQRIKSNSTAASKYLSSLLKNTVETVNINLLDIKPCNACAKCKKAPDCSIRDDAPGLIKKVRNAKIVVVATPIYFTGVPAPLKAFIDRNQAVWEQFKSGKKRGGRRASPKGVIILSGGRNERRDFLPAKREINSFLIVNGIKLVSLITLGNMDEPGAFEKSARCRAKIKKAAGIIKKALKAPVKGK